MNKALENLKHVTVIDDVYDPVEFQPTERDDLWAWLERDDAALEELLRLGHPVSESHELTDKVLADFSDHRNECPALDAIWRKSSIGERIDGGHALVDKWVGRLLGQGLLVSTFGANVPTEKVIATEAQLLFLDWHLGGDPKKAVQGAVDKARAVLKQWPAPKPLIVLMSSRPGVIAEADEFCRRSKILRGMFYPVTKNDLTDQVMLGMYMRLFDQSIQPGRRIQEFIDALHIKLHEVSEEFLNGISELRLIDYAYIQNLSLQSDGQPLGDYLSWLFSTYLGQLLFAEGLQLPLSELNTITFNNVLPSLDSPSERLTEIYHCALFDRNVGPVGPHPWATGGDSAGATNSQPVLTLGDVFQAMSGGVPVAAAAEPAAVDDFEHRIIKDERLIRALATTQPASVAPSAADKVPDLYMVINAQCDLAFTPDQKKRPMNPDRSILLLPGYLEQINKRSKRKSIAKTELYRSDQGQRQRIAWDATEVQTVPHGVFVDWMRARGFERVARLRLPFALEAQRGFANGLTRIGTPVMPPIYQQVSFQAFRVWTDKPCERLEELSADEAVFVILTKDKQQPQQKCILTFTLVKRLKALLEERLSDMQVELESGSERTHLQDKINALKQALADEQKWFSLLFPQNMPEPTRPQKLLGGHIQMVREGDECGADAKLIVSLSLDDDTRSTVGE